MDFLLHNNVFQNFIFSNYLSKTWLYNANIEQILNSKILTFKYNLKNQAFGQPFQKYCFICGFCKHQTSERKMAMVFAGQCTTHWLMSTCILHTRSINNSIIIIMCLPPASFFFVFSLATWMALIWKLGPQCCCCKNFEVHPPFSKIEQMASQSRGNKKWAQFSECM